MAITIERNQKIQSLQIYIYIYRHTHTHTHTQIQMLKLSKCQKRYIIKE